MPVSVEVKLGEFTVGSTHRIQFDISRDDVIWQGIDSIALTFEKPDRTTQFSRQMVLDTDALGRWYYDTTTTEIDVVGWWTLGVVVTDGAVLIEYPYEISFHVNDHP